MALSAMKPNAFRSVDRSIVERERTRPLYFGFRNETSGSECRIESRCGIHVYDGAKNNGPMPCHGDRQNAKQTTTRKARTAAAVGTKAGFSCYALRWAVALLAAGKTTVCHSKYSPYAYHGILPPRCELIARLPGALERVTTVRSTSLEFSIAKFNLIVLQRDRRSKDILWLFSPFSLRGM